MRAATATLTAATAVLLLVGCSGQDGGATVPTRTSEPSPSATPTSLTFEEAAGALGEDLVPTGSVSRCDELAPGSPEAEDYLARSAEELEAAKAEAATSDEAAAPAPSPTLPQCGSTSLGDLRAASVLGHTFAPGDPIDLPIAGGASRAVEVYELPDSDAAEAAVAAQGRDADGWAVNQEIPREDRPDGTYTPRVVISGSSVTDLDLPGWTAFVLGRDESGFQDDGTPAGDPFSTGYVWAARDGIVIRVQVAGDDPGHAGTTATDTARQFVQRIETQG